MEETQTNIMHCHFLASKTSRAQHVSVYQTRGEREGGGGEVAVIMCLCLEGEAATPALNKQL